MFAAIVTPMTFKVLFAITAYYNLDINQIDIKTAFLYGLINQLIYVQISKGLETNVNKKMVCKLLKALYGLKQAPRLWYKKLWEFLLKGWDLKEINVDYSIFATLSGINSLIVSTFIDNINVIEIKKLGHIKRVKKKLIAVFEIVDIGPIGFYLGLKVEKDCQKKH